LNRSKVFNLLAAGSPNLEVADKVKLYGQFVGSWDITGTWYRDGNAVRTAAGEWHFEWILGGRGVQDVLFPVGAPADHYGTTLRCYDQQLDVWHITWMQPYGGEFVNLIGRKVSDRIVQESLPDTSGTLERWSFTEITADSFLWIGERSMDGGLIWILEQEMRAVRRK
jgi:hypothetical protein